jgi:hypothetical protein
VQKEVFRVVHNTFHILHSCSDASLPQHLVFSQFPDLQSNTESCASCYEYLKHNSSLISDFVEHSLLMA